jgi:hypothetical protein
MCQRFLPWFKSDVVVRVAGAQVHAAASRHAREDVGPSFGWARYVMAGPSEQGESRVGRAKPHM